jgi:hypothetical protein
MVGLIAASKNMTQILLVLNLRTIFKAENKVNSKILGKTIEEAMVLERQKLRPWGGSWGFKWPMLDQRPQLMRLTT